MSTPVYFRQDFLRTPDGARIYFQVQGAKRASRPAVVLCDGLGCDGFAWKYLLPELRERSRVLRWHYRGHGLSSMPEEPERLGIHYSCDDLNRLMELTEIDRAVIFGHSMGVQVALEFHRRYKHRVAGLVLICGSYGTPLDTFHDTGIMRSAFPVLLVAVERFPDLAKRITESVLQSPWVLEAAARFELNSELIKRKDLVPYFRHLAHMNPRAFVHTLDSLKDHSAWDHLPHVDVPTLVLAGEADTFTPAWLSRKMAEAIPNAELVMIPQGSHAAPLEQPKLVSESVGRFLHHLGVASTPPA